MQSKNEPSQDQVRQGHTLKCKTHLGSLTGKVIILIIIVVIIVVLGIVLGAPGSLEDAPEWKGRLSTSSDIVTPICSSPTCFIHGRYELVSVDDSYYDYLSELGVPWFAISILKRMTEKIEIRPPANPEKGFWLMSVDRGVKAINLKFRMHEPYEVSLGSFLTLKRNCTLSNPSEILCEAVDVANGLTIESLSQFSGQGLVNTLILDDRNLTTHKYYKRID